MNIPADLLACAGYWPLSEAVHRRFRIWLFSRLHVIGCHIDKISAGENNMCSYTSIPPYTFMAWCTWVFKSFFTVETYTQVFNMQRMVTCLFFLGWYNRFMTLWRAEKLLQVKKNIILILFVNILLSTVWKVLEHYVHLFPLSYVQNKVQSICLTKSTNLKFHYIFHKSLLLLDLNLGQMNKVHILTMLFL